MRAVMNGAMYILSTGCQWRYISSVIRKGCRGTRDDDLQKRLRTRPGECISRATLDRFVFAPHIGRSPRTETPRLG
jgi:hypothetical protein